MESITAWKSVFLKPIFNWRHEQGEKQRSLPVEWCFAALNPILLYSAPTINWVSYTTASTATIDITDRNTGILAFIVEANPTFWSGATNAQQTFYGTEARSQLTLTNLNGNTQYAVQVKACAAFGYNCGDLSSVATFVTEFIGELSTWIRLIFRHDIHSIDLELLYL